MIDKELYNDLYIEYYTEYKRPKRKSKLGYRFTRYYPELHYCTVDYYGEADEHSIIHNIEEQIYWSTVDINNKGEIIKHGQSFLKTKNLIKYLRKETGGER